MFFYVSLLILSLVLIFFLHYRKKKLDVAVIVEPREHEYLVPVVLNIIENVPKYTKIYIFHGSKNLNFIKTHFEEQIKLNKIILIDLEVENLTIKEYNLLLTSRDFWEKIDGEHILIFQTDSCMCSNASNKIEDFLKYDYVGAPWGHIPNSNGGNGGFSLRKKSKMLEIIKNHVYNNLPEDVYFSNHCKNLPSRDVSKKFSVEGIYYDAPVGVHKPWALMKKMSKKDLMRFRQKCPEIHSIFNK